MMQPTRYDSLADSPMSQNRPTPETAKLLREELLFPARDADLPVGGPGDIEKVS